MREEGEKRERRDGEEISTYSSTLDGGQVINTTYLCPIPMEDG